MRYDFLDRLAPVLIKLLQLYGVERVLLLLENMGSPCTSMDLYARSW